MGEQTAIEWTDATRSRPTSGWVLRSTHDPRAMPTELRALLLQAMGRPHAEGRRPTPGRAGMERVPPSHDFSTSSRFLDGFAGPGEYKGGEQGSPVIVLNAFRQHSARKKITADVRFVFVEKHEDRARHLERLLQPLAAELPPRSVEVVRGAFEETLTKELDALTDAGAVLAPCFAMVNPFGVSDTPMEVIARTLAHPKSEIYISVMYEHINRFRGSSEFRDPPDSLYGCDDWRAYVDLDDGRERRRGLFDLYKRQLRQAGAEHVVHFDLYDRGQHKYSIFHASRHPRASNEMKAAIWSVDPGGGFVFHGGQTEQLPLGVEPNFRPLQDALRCEFRGDRCYHLSQLRKHALIPMEDAGEIEVRMPGKTASQQAMIPGLLEDGPPPPRKVRNYPQGTKLRIVRAAPGSHPIAGG